MSDVLVAWLRAQVDADEAAARAASDLGDAGVHTEWVSAEESGHAWRYPIQGVYALTDHAGSSPLVAPDVWPEIQPHIARHDPARVLREVKAKRRIIDEAAHSLANAPSKAYEFDEAQDVARAEVWRTVVRLLALPYANHPDYREEWRP